MGVEGDCGGWSGGAGGDLEFVKVGECCLAPHCHAVFWVWYIVVMSSIALTCRRCGHEMLVRRKLHGGRVKCAGCLSDLEVRPGGLGVKGYRLTEESAVDAFFVNTLRRCGWFILVMAVTAPLLPLLGVQWKTFIRLPPGVFWMGVVVSGVMGLGMVFLSHLPAKVVKWGIRGVVGLVLLALLGIAVMMRLYAPGGLLAPGASRDARLTGAEENIARMTREADEGRRKILEDQERFRKEAQRWAEDAAKRAAERRSAQQEAKPSTPTAKPGVPGVRHDTSPAKPELPASRAMTRPSVQAQVPSVPNQRAQRRVRLVFSYIPAGMDMKDFLEEKLKSVGSDVTWEWNEGEKTLVVKGTVFGRVMVELSPVVQVERLQPPDVERQEGETVARVKVNDAAWKRAKG